MKRVYQENKKAPSEKWSVVIVLWAIFLMLLSCADHEEARPKSISSDNTAWEALDFDEVDFPTTTLRKTTSFSLLSPERVLSDFVVGIARPQAYLRALDQPLTAATAPQMGWTYFSFFQRIFLNSFQTQAP
ncbi:hypothetical protein [Nitritalea halalkaliphila]|nr:hypothetical protein [Nitritalea halalkaliphila]